MFSKIFITGLLTACMSITAYATPANPATIQKLIVETKMEQLIEESLLQMKPMVDEQILQEAKKDLGQKQLDAKQLNIVKQLQQLSWQQINVMNNWQNMQKLMVEIYQKHFTEEELQATLKFYQSPEGSSMMKKMPLMMGDMMQKLQANLQDITPSADAENEIKQLKKQLNATKTKKPSK